MQSAETLLAIICERDTTGGRNMNHWRAVCNESCMHRSERGGRKRAAMHLACLLLYWNRTTRKLPKTHWLDAACVGASTPEVLHVKGIVPLLITATGRQRRQMCLMNKFGFPRTKGKGPSTVEGFRTGDMAKAMILKGTKVGTYVGRVAVRETGYFNITTSTGTIQGVNFKCFTPLHRSDGYAYHTPQKGRSV